MRYLEGKMKIWVYSGTFSLFHFLLVAAALYHCTGWSSWAGDHGTNWPTMNETSRPRSGLVTDQLHELQRQRAKYTVTVD